MLMVLEQSEPKVKEVGIQLVDLRVKRINYIQAVQERVFERIEPEMAPARRPHAMTPHNAPSAVLPMTSVTTRTKRSRPQMSMLLKMTKEPLF